MDYTDHTDHEHCEVNGACWQDHEPCPALISKGAAIAREAGAEAAGLLANLMDRNERDTQWAVEQGRKGLERERDVWRERALAAESRMERIEQRVWEFLS